MHEINFLDVNDVILIHRNQIQLYGGGFAIRDMGLLESALAQPCSRFSGDYLHEFPLKWPVRIFFILCKTTHLLMETKGLVLQLVYCFSH